MLKDETKNNISLKKERKKKKANSGESHKPVLISQTCNLWNPRLELN
jgi:hypothetical protein